MGCQAEVLGMKEVGFATVVTLGTGLKSVRGESYSRGVDHESLAAA